MDIEADTPEFRSGFVAVVGRPNVGKSTLLNALLGQKLAIVSPKPQTTRRKQLGIYTTDKIQIVFVDTPGIGRPRHALDRTIMATATRALEDADTVLWLVDVSSLPGPSDRHIAELLTGEGTDTPVIIAMNKSDKLSPDKVLSHTDAYRELVPEAAWMLTSATRGDNLDELLRLIVAALPEGPQYYPEDQITETHVRDLAAELIREAALHYLRDEVPHGVAVEINEFDETTATIRIEATIYVEQERHKGMVIGKGGQMLKQIGSRARKEIMMLLETDKVYVGLHVSVREGWRSDERELRRLGYKTE